MVSLRLLFLLGACLLLSEARPLPDLQHWLGLGKHAKRDDVEGKEQRQRRPCQTFEEVFQQILDHSFFFFAGPQATSGPSSSPAARAMEITGTRLTSRT